jgi:hypothetical protein
LDLGKETKIAWSITLNTEEWKVKAGKGESTFIFIVML